MWSFEQFNLAANIPFMDLCVVTVTPLTYCIHFKSTNTASYIFWSSDHARNTKRGWIRGEGISALRLCSHERFFDLCRARFILAVKRLGYPRAAYTPFPCSWAERDTYCKRKPRQLGGVIHVFTHRHATSVPVKWSGLVKHLADQLRCYIPQVKLFAISQSAPPPQAVCGKGLDGKHFHNPRCVRKSLKRTLIFFFL